MWRWTSTTTPDARLQSRFWLFAFVFLMALECMPFWVFHYFPSQDGPSHLYNAAVLANYQAEPNFREFYRLTPLQPAGNLLTQFLLVGMVKLVPPWIAEKLLLTGYAVLLFVSFRYLLRGLTPLADYFSVAAGILAPNVFLYLGFWNFLYSICLLLLVIGYYVRQKQRWAYSSLLTFVVAGFILYATHAVSWLICVAAVGLLALARWLGVIFGPERPPKSIGLKALWQIALPVLSLLPPAAFLLFHLARSRAATVCPPESLRSRLWSVYSLYFLHTLTIPRLLFSKLVAATLAGALFCVLVTALRRRQYDLRTTGLLAVSLMCGALAIFGPACVGTGTLIRERVTVYACVFLVLWLAAQRWPRVGLVAFSTTCFCLTLIAWWAALPTYVLWDRVLSEFVALGQHIRPGATVLTLVPERAAEETANPELHAVDLLANRSVIDLLDYEALTEYFSTEFRSDRSPVPALGTILQLSSVPTQVDIARYEKQTGARIDYIFIIQGNPSFPSGNSEWLENRVYKKQLAGFKLIASGRTSSIRLYERSAGS